MIPHVVLCLAHQRERMAYQNLTSNSYLLSCSGVAISFVKLQVWSFHKWYRYTTTRQYRSLMLNSGTPSFLVGMQDIGPHEVS